MSQCVISKVLPRLIAERGISQTQLAKKSGVALSTLSTWLIEGARPRDLESVDKVAAVLGVSFEELVFDRKPRERQIDLDSLPLEKLLDGLYRLKIERVVLSEFQSGERKTETKRRKPDSD